MFAQTHLLFRIAFTQHRVQGACRVLGNARHRFMDRLHTAVRQALDNDVINLRRLFFPAWTDDLIGLQIPREQLNQTKFGKQQQKSHQHNHSVIRHEPRRALCSHQTVIIQIPAIGVAKKSKEIRRVRRSADVPGSFLPSYPRIAEAQQGFCFGAVDIHISSRLSYSQQVMYE